METKNVYEDIVHLAFNIFKNEKTRTMIKLDSEFEDKLLVLINDILLLEKDFDATWAEKTWFADYAKTLVNIVQKKLKFEKVDNKKVEETYRDYSDIIVYVTKNFEMKRDEIASEVSRPNADDLKFYQVVTSEMLDRYKKAEPKVEVINDGEKVKADTSTNKQESNYNQGGFAGAGPGIGGNPFVNNGMPQNPMANDRFYPYRTKPKYTRILRYVIAGLALLFGVFTVIVFVLSVLSSRTTTLDELMKNIPGYNDTFKVDTDTYSVGSFVLGAGIKVKDFSFYSGIIFTLLYLGVIGWMVSRMVRPVKTFREYYATPASIFMILTIMLVFIFIYSVYGNISLISYSRDDEINSIVKSLGNVKDGVGKVFISTVPDTTFAWDHTWDQAIIDTLTSKVLTDSFESIMNTFGAFLIVYVVLFAAIFITVVVSWFLNPRYDREKIGKLQVEIQMQMQYAMQGQRYDIDQSLFTSDQEYNEVMEKINKRRNNKKAKDRNLD